MLNLSVVRLNSTFLDSQLRLDGLVSKLMRILQVRQSERDEQAND